MAKFVAKYEDVQDQIDRVTDDLLGILYVDGALGRGTQHPSPRRAPVLEHVTGRAEVQ